MRVMQEWTEALPLQQQSVLMLALRGPDGVGKNHPCKPIARAYRASVIKAARYGQPLDLEHRLRGDSFMSLMIAEPSQHHLWRDAVHDYFAVVDALPHHYHLHLMHGAQIVGYRHFDNHLRSLWLDFYANACEDMHLPMESREHMDERLSDWNQKDWS